jgi:hypothetical protein
VLFCNIILIQPQNETFGEKVSAREIAALEPLQPGRDLTARGVIAESLAIPVRSGVRSVTYFMTLYYRDNAVLSILIGSNGLRCLSIEIISQSTVGKFRGERDKTVAITRGSALLAKYADLCACAGSGAFAARFRFLGHRILEHQGPEKDGYEVRSQCRWMPIHQSVLQQRQSRRHLRQHEQPRCDQEFPFRCLRGGRSRGAMFVDPEHMELRNSCMVRCYLTTTNSRGSALWNEPDSGNSYIDDSSFLGNYANPKGTEGTVFVDAGTDGHVAYNRDNFTSCQASNTGAAFKMGDESKSWEAHYLILLDLIGDTGIDSSTKSRQTVDHYNFYDNVRLSSSWGVVYGQTTGMVLDSCIFRNNARDLHINSYSWNGHEFQITNSVFSASFQLEIWITRGGNCYQTSWTMSWNFVGAIGQSDRESFSGICPFAPARAFRASSCIAGVCEIRDLCSDSSDYFAPVCGVPVNRRFGCRPFCVPPGDRKSVV